MIAYFDEIDHISDEKLEKMKLYIPAGYRKKIERYKGKERKKHRVLAYMLFRYCIMEEYGIDGIAEFSYGEYGKPYVESADFYFNFSHTKSAVACVVSHSPVGIDVQDIVKDYQRIQLKSCTSKEIRCIKCSIDPQRTFTRLWTLKEAFVKYKGTGIWDHLNQIDFSSMTGGVWKQGNCYYYTIEEQNYVVTVCSEEQDHIVTKVRTLDIEV